MEPSKNNGILRAQDISTELISEYHAYADTIGDTYICLYSVRFFLQFLAEHGVIAGHVPLALTSPLQAKAASYAIKRFSTEISSFETNGVDADEYWKMANSLIDVLRKEHYHNEDATRNNYLVYYQMFYIKNPSFHNRQSGQECVPVQDRGDGSAEGSAAVLGGLPICRIGWLRRTGTFHELCRPYRPHSALPGISSLTILQAVVEG